MVNTTKFIFPWVQSKEAKKFLLLIFLSEFQSSLGAKVLNGFSKYCVTFNFSRLKNRAP